MENNFKIDKGDELQNSLKNSRSSNSHVPLNNDHMITHCTCGPFIRPTLFTCTFTSLRVH